MSFVKSMRMSLPDSFLQVLSKDTSMTLFETARIHISDCSYIMVILVKIQAEPKKPPSDIGK